MAVRVDLAAFAQKRQKYSRELQLAFRCCALNEPFLATPIDIQEFFDLCRIEGLLTPLCDRIMEHGHPSAHILETARERFKTEFLQWAQYKHLLEQIHEGLEQRGMDVVLLKGSALTLTLYAPPHLRHLSDLDICVHQRDLGKMAELLRELGLAGSSNGKSFRDQHGKTVDVHSGQLGLVEAAYGLHLDSLWSRSVPLADHPRFRTLAPRDLLEHLSLHSVKHSYSRLVWLLDIHLFFSNYTGIEPSSRPSRWAAYLRNYLISSGGTVPGAGLSALERRFLQSASRRMTQPWGQLFLATVLPGFTNKCSYLLAALSLDKEGRLGGFRRQVSRLARLLGQLLGLSPLNE